MTTFLTYAHVGLILAGWTGLPALALVLIGRGALSFMGLV